MDTGNLVPIRVRASVTYAAYRYYVCKTVGRSDGKSSEVVRYMCALSVIKTVLNNQDLFKLSCM